MKRYFLVIVVVIACYYPLRNSLHRLLTVNGGRFSTDIYKLDLINRPIQQAVSFINSQVSPEKKLLALRQGDISYYTDHEFVGQFDQRLTKVFDSKDVESLYRYLKEELGLDYIYVPEYGEPVVYNSKLQDLISNPDYVDLLADFSGYRIYKLDFDQSRMGSEIAKFDFLREGFSVLDGKKDIKILEEAESYKFEGSFTDRKSKIISGFGEISLSGDKIKSSDFEYILGELVLNGRGRVTVKLVQYHSQGVRTFKHLWDGAISNEKKVSMMTRLGQDILGYRVLVEIETSSNLEILKLETKRFQSSIQNNSLGQKWMVRSSKRSDPISFSSQVNSSIEIFGADKHSTRLQSRRVFNSPANSKISLKMKVRGCGVVVARVVNDSRTRDYFLGSSILEDKSDQEAKLIEFSSEIYELPPPVDLVPKLKRYVNNWIQAVVHSLNSLESENFRVEVELTKIRAQQPMCTKTSLQFDELNLDICNAEGKCQSL